MGIGAALAGGTAVSAVGSIFGGLTGSQAAVQAAQIQADAARQGQAIQQAEFNQIQANLAPFQEGGTSALSTLQTMLPGLTKPFQPTTSQLEQTPGYQFTLDQGEKSVINNNAALGLAKSGALGKGLVNYAEGLAGTTFQQQFQNYTGQNQQIYNMFANLTNLGENAAATSGQQGLQSASNITNLLTGAGAAQAAGVVGSANAINQGVAGVGSAANNAALLLALSKGGMFGTPEDLTSLAIPGTTV